LVRWSLILLFLLSCGYANTPFEKLKTVFQATLIEQNPNAISRYYHPDLRLYTNGKKMDFDTYVKTHQGMYKPGISYEFTYDKATIVQEGEKVATRLWLTELPSQKMVEVILIVEFKGDQIYRLWELTYPDWQAALR
jgi:predicted ester cyclase